MITDKTSERMFKFRFKNWKLEKSLLTKRSSWPASKPVGT